MSVKWNAAMAEFEVGLIRVPQDLLVQANRIVQEEANYAAVQIRAKYPVRTGNLRDHVVVRQRVTPRGDIVVTVVNTARHALIYELGTKARHYFTVNGVRKEVGAMPPGRVFLTLVPPRKRVMFERLKALVAQSGFRVVGDAAA